jgi:hypothetical protein
MDFGILDGKLGPGSSLTLRFHGKSSLFWLRKYFGSGLDMGLGARRISFRSSCRNQLSYRGACPGSGFGF